MKSLGIRWRLTLAYAGLVMLLLTGLSAIVLLRVGQHLRKQADLSLKEEVDELIEELNHFHNRQELLVQLESRYDVHSHYYFQLLDEDLHCLFQSRFLTNVQLPKPQVSPGEMRGTQYSDIELDKLGRFRLVDMAVRDSESEPLLLRAVSSKLPAEKDFWSYVQIFLAVLPVALVATLATGYHLVGRMLSPIKQIVATAKTISANQLDQRLPVVNSYDELGELSQALNSTFDRLEKSMSAIRNFTSDAAHELRSPLAVLRTEAEIALRRHRTPDELRAVVETTLRETKRLGDIVEQLLALSRHDAGVQAMLSDEVPICAVLKDVVARFEPMAMAKRIQLKSDDFPNVTVQGNDIWLSQLFTNLLENALKFTEAGGAVTVQSYTSDDMLNILIQDTGIGLKPDEMRHIFERFYRADASRQHHKGTGLGLAICKSIVESHKGSISVQSEPGEGSTFFIRFPIAAALDDSHDGAIQLKATDDAIPAPQSFYAD